MSTVGVLINRIKRDWLEPADYQPTRFKLAVAITDVAATTLTFDQTFMTPEEQDLFGPGTLIELEEEEIIVGSVDETTNILSGLKRGANGTTAATHAINTEGLIAPTWRRKAIFDAVSDAVDQTFPDLYQVLTSTALTVGASYTEVPAACVTPMWFWGHTSNGTGDYEKYAPTLMDQFPPSSTGKAIRVPQLEQGATGYLVYKAEFTRPTDETTDLVATCGLLAAWEQVVLLTAVIYLIAGREPEQIAQKRLSQQLEQAGFPVLSASRIRDGLIRYRDQLMQDEKDDLRERYHVLTTVAQVI